MRTQKTTGLLLLSLIVLLLPLTACATKPKPPTVVEINKPYPLPDTACPAWPVWNPPALTNDATKDFVRMQKEVAVYTAEAWGAYACERDDNTAKLEAMRRAEKAVTP